MSRGCSSWLQAWESCSWEGAYWEKKLTIGRECHLSVSVLNEEIHNDHDQNGDGDSEVPNDPSQLREGGKIQSVLSCFPTSCLPLAPTPAPSSCRVLALSGGSIDI